MMLLANNCGHRQVHQIRVVAGVPEPPGNAAKPPQPGALLLAQAAGADLGLLHGVLQRGDSGEMLRELAVSHRLRRLRPEGTAGQEPSDLLHAAPTFILLTAFALAGFVHARKRQIKAQYPWLAGG